MDDKRKMLCAWVKRSIAREWVSSYVLPVGSGPERGILRGGGTEGGVFPSNERIQTAIATSQSSQRPVMWCVGMWNHLWLATPARRCGGGGGIDRVQFLASDVTQPGLHSVTNFEKKKKNYFENVVRCCRNSLQFTMAKKKTLRLFLEYK